MKAKPNNAAEALRQNCEQTARRLQDQIRQLDAAKIKAVAELNHVNGMLDAIEHLHGEAPKAQGPKMQPRRGSPANPPPAP